MIWIRKAGLHVALGLVVGVVSGCDLPRDRHPSIILVAVEGLSFETLSCDANEVTDRVFEGIRAFCEEGVRFSHAFSPSTMSQATMASLLTGLYPYDHGVHHNGRDFLAAHYHTLAEGALNVGYHTIFVSGGAPIWRKSGLAQGFEVFDDVIDVGPGVYYRQAPEVVKIATNWLEQQSAGHPFLSVMFLNDLQFPQVTTKTHEGEVRARTADSQLEAVAEALGGLVRWLRLKHRWNNTHIVLVGMNSLQHHENDTEALPLSLRSSSVQVSLFVKPARKEGDNVIQWAVDRNISLVDVGKTMFEWLGLAPQPSSIYELEPESLVAAVQQIEPHWQEGRLILSETAWPDWLEGSGTRWAMRQNQFLYIHDRRPQVFNTLTDRLETLPLKVNDPLWASLNTEVLALIKKTGVPPWMGMKPRWPEQIAIARRLWLTDVAPPLTQGTESWSRWALSRALQKRDWQEVNRLTSVTGEPIGRYVAERHLGEMPALPHNSCVRLVLTQKSDHQHALQSDCEDEKILSLHAWQIAKTEDERVAAQERFVRLLGLKTLDQEVGRLNYLNELRWDVDREIPRAPQPIDYLLTLKELEPFAKKVSALLNSKDLAF